MYIGCSFENFSHLLQMFYPVDEYSVNGRGKHTLREPKENVLRGGLVLTIHSVLATNTLCYF